MSYPTISMRELEQWMTMGREMYLVDLQTQRAYRMGHLRGAVNIPYEQLGEHLEELPRTVPVVFYCARGSKSMLVCNRLQGTGLMVVNTGGGLAAYRGKYLVRS